MTTCNDCRFWKQHNPDYDSGNCRAHPPVAWVLEGNGGSRFDTLWPATAGFEWCGEHEPKEIGDE